MVRKKPAKSHARNHTHKHSGSTKVFPIIVAVLVLIVIGAGYYTFKDSLILFWRETIRAQIVRRIPAPTPTPHPIAHGVISYSGGGNVSGIPRYTNITFNPYDPANNTQQVITVNISSDTPVNSFYAILQSDHHSNMIKFALTQGTNTSGTWQGTWTVNDTYLYNYELDLYGTNNAGTNKAQLMLR